MKELEKIVALSIPSSLGALLGFVQQTINLIFIGHLGDPVKVSAVGMGNMILNMSGYATIFGLNSALETLVSQAFGAKNYKFCSIYLQQGRIVLTLAFIPVAAFCFFSQYFMKWFRQDEDVIQQSYIYVLSSLPGIFFLGMADIQRKLLIQIGMSKLSTYVQIVSTICHVGFNYYFVYHMGLGVVGTGVSTCCTGVLLHLGNMYMTRWVRELDAGKDIRMLDRVVLTGVNQYFKMGLPALLVLVADWTCFELMVLMSGFMGVNEQATLVIQMNIVTLFFQISYGIQQASCSLIGRHIGGRDLLRATAFFKIVIIVAVVFEITQFGLLVQFRNHLFAAFTNSKITQSLAEDTAIFSFIVMALDCFQGILFGSIKALNRQDRTVRVNYTTYYVITFPLAIYLGFYAGHSRAVSESKSADAIYLDDYRKGQGLKGLWMGFIAGLSHQIILYFFIILKEPWELAVEEATKRLNAIEETVADEENSFVAVK